nr:hypothetical protein [Tanacetum cinerariifolium]
MTMDTIIEQQAAMDEALVPHAQRLKIGRSNFRLLSDIKSKESTLQLVYDVLRIYPFFKAFLVTTKVPEIYMQEFWATATVHHHAIRFKMDNKKHIMNLESSRDMLHIYPRVHGQSFDKPPFEEEIFAFIHFLGHSATIRTLTDVNINKLYQPWRSFAAIINKCLNGKSSGYDSLRLSQAQILNVDYAYLMWEDFVYQVEHKNHKKSNEMYYSRSQRRNKVNWHYVRDDHMFSTIKLVSRHQNMQQFGALLPIELTNKETRNFNAYKEYYAIATGAAPPKPKASVRRNRSSSDTSITPPTVVASPRLTASEKGKQTAKASKAKSLSALSKDGDDDEEDEGNDGEEGHGDDDNEDDDGEEGNDDDDDQEVERDDDKDDEEEGGDDDQEYNEEYDKETRDEESFDPISKTPENSDDEGNGNEDLGLNVGREEGHIEEEEEDELYKDVNINQGRGLQTTLDVEDSHVTLTPVNPDGMESIFETTSQMDVSTPTSVAHLPMTAPTMTPSTIATITTTSQAPILPTTVPSIIIQNLPNFGSLFRFDDRLRSLEANFSEAMQTNQFAGAVSAILGIVQQYMDQRMNEAVKVAGQIQSDRLRDEAQRENDELLKTVDENMQKIIKEQVKEQVKVQVSKILLRIKQAVNEQLEAEVLTRSSHSSKTSYAVAADLSEMELKKILIKKMEGNKETVTLKRRRDDDADKDEEPSAGPDRGSKRRREGKEPERQQASLLLQSSLCRPPVRWRSPHIQSLTQKPPTSDRDWNKIVPATHGSIQPWISELAKRSDSRSFFNELMDTPLDFSNFLINRLKVDTLTPELLPSPTYELMKGSCKSLVELEYHLEEVFKATTDHLDWVNPEGASSRKYTTSITKTKAADYGHIKWIEDLVPRTMWIEEPIGYDKHALLRVSHWGRKRQQFYGFAVNRESARNVCNTTKNVSQRKYVSGVLLYNTTAQVIE